MGLFDFMKGKKENVIAAPVKGECIPISEVADPTFAEEILGKGMAIKPTEGKFYAPADGTISTLFPTGHAIGLTTSEGVELLIHVGIDTVEMKGDGFKSHIKEGQAVKKGDLLLTIDLEKIKARPPCNHYGGSYEFRRAGIGGSFGGRQAYARRSADEPESGIVTRNRIAK